MALFTDAIETETETDRERETETQRDRNTDRQTDRQKETNTIKTVPFFLYQLVQDAHSPVNKKLKRISVTRLLLNKEQMSSRVHFRCRVVNIIIMDTRQKFIRGRMHRGPHSLCCAQMSQLFPVAFDYHQELSVQIKRVRLRASRQSDWGVCLDRL